MFETETEKKMCPSLISQLATHKRNPLTHTQSYTTHRKGNLTYRMCSSFPTNANSIERKGENGWERSKMHSLRCNCCCCFGFYLPGILNSLIFIDFFLGRRILIVKKERKRGLQVFFLRRKLETGFGLQQADR